LTEEDVEGKIYVTDFFFTSCPGICPKMTANMMLIQEAFLHDEDVLLLSHSVTPEYDSVAVLKEYAELEGVEDTKWHLLTGDRQMIYDLGRYQYFVEEDLGLVKDTEEFIHTENFVLIDRSRRIRGIYNGLNKAAVSQLIADIKTLQNSNSFND
ncbi:MAG: SCO family protein, partial [Bacteroidota bacterium]